MGGNVYEHVLDFGPFLTEPLLDVSSSKNGSYSPTKPQPDLRKNDEDLDFPLGDRERGSRTLPRAPALDALPLNYSGDNYNPPSWSQTRFKFGHPLPGCVSLFPPPIPHPGVNNPRSGLDSSLPPGSEKLLSHDDASHNPDRNLRKSCEYCRFRKRKCSGHDTCILCFRIGIDCIYMPDLIAKRVADSLMETSSPGSGARSCVTSNGPGDDPMEGPTQTSGRGTKIKKSKRVVNEKPGVAKRKRLRARKDSTQSMVPNAGQSVPRSNCPNSVNGVSRPVYIGPAHSSSRAIGLAAEDMGFQNTEPRCVDSDVFDRKVTPAPECWDIYKPQEDFGDIAAILLGYTENNARVPQPTSITTTEWFPWPGAPLDAETAPTSGFDVFPLTGTGMSPEPLPAPSLSPLSIPLPSLGPTMLSDFTSDHDPTEPWTVDDWLSWYDAIFFLG